MSYYTERGLRVLKDKSMHVMLEFNVKPTTCVSEPAPKSVELTQLSELQQLSRTES